MKQKCKTLCEQSLIFYMYIVIIYYVDEPVIVRCHNGVRNILRRLHDDYYNNIDIVNYNKGTD